MRLTLATYVTLTRFAVVPFFIAALLAHAWWPALLLLGVAAISDFLDGFLARALRQVTELGTILDPVADKLLLMSWYGAVASDLVPLEIPSWFVATVLGRELVLLAGGSYRLFVCRLSQVRPTLLGKLTMAVQLFFMGVCLVLVATDVAIPALVCGTSWLLLLLLLASTVEYCILGFAGGNKCHVN